jgi:putative addiction module killer protein
MFTLLRSPEFNTWLAKLKDSKGKARIVARLKSVELGNLGDFASVGQGVSEMRIHFGPGYRVYYTQRGNVVILLLLGGDKGTQQRDIIKAQELAKTIKD